MKFFYWAADDLVVTDPPLYVINEVETYPQPRYGVTQGEVAELLSQGYKEISTRTAYKLGLIV